MKPKDVLDFAKRIFTKCLLPWVFLIWSQDGSMILRLNTKSSNALVLDPNSLKMFGLQAFIGTCGSDKQSVIGTKT